MAEPERQQPLRWNGLLARDVKNYTPDHRSNLLASGVGIQEDAMNEHQSGRLSSGTREGGMESPGGNSPVMGGAGLDVDRFRSQDSFDTEGAAYRQDLRSHRTRADLPYRAETFRDETIRAGQHRYPRTTGGTSTEWLQGSTLPALAIGLGGAALFGWLLSRLGGSSHRSEWEERPYMRQNRWREQDSFSARSSGYGTSGYGTSGYGRSRSVATDETWDLIASDKVEGTAVYDRKGEKLGSVYNFMVGKRSGQVAYAVLSFGGWLGMGESYHPLPWNTLTYDTEYGGYVVNLDKDRLRNAPSHKAGQDASDAGYWRRVKDYWG